MLLAPLQLPRGGELRALEARLGAKASENSLEVSPRGDTEGVGQM
jgi:hypothetical protein